MTYTTTDFLTAIEREEIKRITTYPKMIARQQKAWQEQGLDVATETHTLAMQHKKQREGLNRAYFVFKHGAGHGFNPESVASSFRELQREFSMRKKCYPRWLRWGRMDADTAQREIAVWQALADHFHATYCPDVPLRAPRKKKTITAPSPAG